MTKQEAFEFIKNTKIIVVNNAEKLQEKLFEIGFKWPTPEQKIQHTDKPFLYISEDGGITYGLDIVTFRNSTKKILKVSEILEIKIDDIKIPDFKPFDKVLVRSWDEDKWKIELFEKYEASEIYPYKCLEFKYKQCIPFEGNEHLLGTTNKPE